MIAVDYCHKIKCYFNGITEEEVKARLTATAPQNGANRIKDIGHMYEMYWRIKTGKQKARGRATTSPQNRMTMEGLKERALQISRMSEDHNGGSSEEKRLTIILLKEIETYLANRNEVNVTPIKNLISIKSQSHLRMRAGSASRSSTSLHGPYLMINQSNKRSKPLNLNSSQSKSRSKSRQLYSHVHMIPTASHDN
jgi:hypothetical protein